MPKVRPAYAVKSGRMTQDERTMIDQLADAGLRCVQISRHLKRHPTTIYFYMATHGHIRRIAQRHVEYRRNGGVVKPFSPREDQFIEELRCQQISIGQIADRCREQFGHRRTPQTVGTRLRMLASAAEAADA